MANLTRISPQEASQKLAEGWTYVDVRTVEEFEAGHPPGAVNVPIALAAPGRMMPNPDFLPVMAAAFRKDAKIVVGCKAGGRSMRAAYPPAEQPRVLDAWREEAEAPDGPDVFVVMAKRNAWLERLQRDLSGIAHVEVQGERATVVTVRGTRYPFRRRDNGIWGLTIFTAQLQAEAERAARDMEMVEKAAGDYEHARGP